MARLGRTNSVKRDTNGSPADVGTGNANDAKSPHTQIHTQHHQDVTSLMTWPGHIKETLIVYDRKLTPT